MDRDRRSSTSTVSAETIALVDERQTSYAEYSTVCKVRGNANLNSISNLNSSISDKEAIGEWVGCGANLKPNYRVDTHLVVEDLWAC